MLNSSTCPIAFLVTEAHMFANATAAVDDLERELAQQLPSSIALATALLLSSLFVLFLGNKLVKPTLFIVSFFAAAFATLLFIPAVINAANVPDTAACVAVGVTPIVVGIAAALVSFFFLNLGFVLLGGASGAGLGYVLYTAFLHRFPIHPVGSHDVMFIICLAVGGLVGAIALLKQKNNVFITATAAAGACGATPAIALLLAHANIHWLGAFNTGLKSPPQFVWPQAVVAGGLFLLGLLVQCRLAAHDKKVKARNTDAMRNAQVPLIVP